MRNFKIHGVHFTLLCLLLQGISGCVNYIGIHQKQKIIKPNQLATKKSLLAKQGLWPKSDWTKQFADPQLTFLIQEAIAHNPDLQVAVAREYQAQALVEGHNAPLLPKIEAYGMVARNKITYPLLPTWQNFGFGALNFSYELDFWGKNYSLLAQALSEEKVSQASCQASTLMITTSVASLYNQLSYEYDLKDILQHTVRQRKILDEITKVRVSSGLGTEVQIYQAHNLYGTARTQLAAVNGQIITTRQQLGVLLGLGPDRGFSITRPKLSKSTAPSLPPNLPLNLIGRRPDIVAARWQVEAALSGVKYMKSKFYPNVNLFAAAAYFSFGADRLFRRADKLLAAAPAFSLPLFDAGLLRAQLKGEYAVLDEQIALYNSTLNKALGEVAQTLTATRSIDQQLQEHRYALISAQHAYELSRKQYRIGLTSQLVVLDAETRYLEAQQTKALLIKSRRDMHIALIKALGGGFDESALPTPRTTVTPEHLLKKDTHV